MKIVRLILTVVVDLWCGWTHGGGHIMRDPSGRVNWQCAKCGRWAQPVLDSASVLGQVPLEHFELRPQGDSLFATAQVENKVTNEGAQFGIGGNVVATAEHDIQDGKAEFDIHLPMVLRPGEVQQFTATAGQSTRTGCMGTPGMPFTVVPASGVVAGVEVDRDSDGELLIDWSPGKGRMLTLSLRADGRLSYAFTWDGEQAHGTAQMPAGAGDGAS